MLRSALCFLYSLNHESCYEVGTIIISILYMREWRTERWSDLSTVAWMEGQHWDLNLGSQMPEYKFNRATGFQVYCKPLWRGHLGTSLQSRWGRLGQHLHLREGCSEMSLPIPHSGLCPPGTWLVPSAMSLPASPAAPCQPSTKGGQIGWGRGGSACSVPLAK